MYKTRNFDEKPFQVLEEFLYKRDISIDQYRAYEWFVRDSLERFSNALGFPDEDFPDSITKNSIELCWKEFEKKHDQEADWGMHPLVSGYSHFYENLENLDQGFAKLIHTLPDDNQIQSLNKFKTVIVKDIEAARKKIANLRLLYEKSKLFRAQESYYLFFSKFLAQELFKDYEIDSLIDEFILIKYQCYFQDSEDLKKDGIVSRIRNIKDKDILVSHINNYLEKVSIQTIMKEFASKRTLIKEFIESRRGRAGTESKN